MKKRRFEVDIRPGKQTVEFSVIEAEKIEISTVEACGWSFAEIINIRR